MKRPQAGPRAVDPEPHWEERLDPAPLKMSADPPPPPPPPPPGHLIPSGFQVNIGTEREQLPGGPYIQIYPDIYRYIQIYLVIRPIYGQREQLPGGPYIQIYPDMYIWLSGLPPQQSDWLVAHLRYKQSFCYIFIESGSGLMSGSMLCLNTAWIRIWIWNTGCKAGFFCLSTQAKLTQRLTKGMIVHVPWKRPCIVLFLTAIQNRPWTD